MGLFSSSKKTYVATSVYNMAGDELERRNFLKDMIITNVLSNQQVGTGELLTTNYLNGPGIKLRQFFNWITQPGRYNHVGLPTGIFLGTTDIVDTDIIPHLPVASDATVLIQESAVGGGDYSWWVDQWVLNNEIDLIDEEFTYDYDDTTNEIVIIREDESEVRFTPVDFSQDENYLYVNYVSASEEEDGPILIGSNVESDPLPSESGWTFLSTNTDNHNVVLKTYEEVDITYSDSTPPEHTGPTEIASESEDYDDVVRLLTKTEYAGSPGSEDETYSLKTNRQTHDTFRVVVVETEDVQSEDIGGGVTKTTTTTTYTDTLEVYRYYRDDTQKTDIKGWNHAQIYIYRLGSGKPALDSLIKYGTIAGTEFFPHIPVRIDNKMITELSFTEAEDQAFKAYKRVMGAKLDKLIEEVADNDDIKDIDYTMVVFGVQANVIENACRKYIYKFFQRLMMSQFADVSDYVTWQTKQSGFKALFARWAEWKEAQENPSDPLYDTPEPEQPEYAYQPKNAMRVATTGDYGSEFNMELKWDAIDEEVIEGLGKPTAKVGEVWFENVPVTDPEYRAYVQKFKFKDMRIRLNVVRAYFQETSEQYRLMTIINMVHINYVYKGKSVETQLADGLVDPEESEFIIPLHYPTYREMSLVDSTQMATACVLLVFNCYKVVKKKWYQKGIFKIVLVVGIVAISIATGGIGAASAGVLGSNIAVGTAIGLTGLAAIVVGAIANAIVAMIILQAVSTVGSMILGDKFGLFVTIIASVVMMNMGNIFGPNGSISLNWNAMLRADNLLKMTSAVGNVYQEYVQGQIQDYAQKTEELMKVYNENLREVRSAYIEQGLYGSATIDPLMFTDQSIPFESSDTYLARTMMTGTDIAEMSMNLLSDFAPLTLSTELPI